MSVSVSTMFVFALVGAITPGPVNILAIRHGTARNMSLPLLFVLGASISYTAVVWLMGTGAQHFLSQPTLVTFTQWLGSGYLLHLAWRIAMAPTNPLDMRISSSEPSAWSGFVQGVASQTLNPKAWLVALSGASLFVLKSDQADAALAVFCGISLLTCLLGVGCWAVLGRLLARWLALPIRQLWLHRLLAAILVLTVARMTI